MMHKRGRRTPGSARRAVLLAAALALAVPAVAGAASFGAHQDAADQNACRRCHNTAAGTPAIKGWAGTGVGPATGWGAKPLSALCYLCHSAGGGPLASSGHNMLLNAYADSSHGFVIADLPPEPEGSEQGSMYQEPLASGLPYTAATFAQIECTSCHNVHVATDRPFSQRASLQALCDECHQGRGNNASGTSSPGTLRAFSTHPTQQALTDTARANIKDVAALDANLKVALAAAPDYALGGHLSAGDSGVGDCQTCHAVHGPTQGSPGVGDLLAIDNATGAGGSALCEGCHYGGNAGEQVGSVAAHLQSGLPAGSWSDHPIDGNVNRTFYPTGVALPANWLGGTTPNGDRGAQPFYTTGVTGTPTCSSCHDTHGGITGTPLLRGPLPNGTFAPTAGFYDEWCFVCHVTSQVLPAGHHSVIDNLATALGDAIDSQLVCGDCHGPAGGSEWLAHNGFWNWAVAVSATDSNLCQACHEPDDPRDLVSPGLKGQTFAEPAVFPASHGTLRGTSSHYLGPDSDEFPGVTPSVLAWSSGYFSSYGSPNTGGGGAVAPAQPGAIICESCHEAVYNDGRANPGSYSLPRRAGWESNLLLEPYQDDPPGLGSGTGANAIGSALCSGCHTEIGIHHPLTGDVVSLSALPLRTGSGSFADAPGVPNQLSYPNVNQMDCDSCHRPHSADTDGDVAGASHGASTSSDLRPTKHILEVDGPAHGYSDLCAECHLR